MIKTLITILILALPITSYSFFSQSESESEICQNFIYKFLNSDDKFKPSIQKVRAVLGKRTNNIAYTHIYYWHELTVTFLNDHYIEHIGTLYVDYAPKDYHKITPKDVMKYHGKPIKIELDQTVFQKWICKRSISDLEIILSKSGEAAKYSGRYCSQNHAKYCRYFEYINN